MMVDSPQLKIRLAVLIALYPGVGLVEELVGGGWLLLTGGLEHGGDWGGRGGREGGGLSCEVSGPKPIRKILTRFTG